MSAESEKARRKAYYEANRDTIRAKQKIYRDRNRDIINARASAWHEAHRDTANAKRKALYWADRDADLAKKAAKYAANPDKTRMRVAIWIKANPEQHRANGALRRARKNNAKIVERIDIRVLGKRDGWICGICGEHVDKSLNYPDSKSKSLDHIVALVNGGDHSYANAQLAHLQCNLRKHTKDQR